MPCRAVLCRAVPCRVPCEQSSMTPCRAVPCRAGSAGWAAWRARGSARQRRGLRTAKDGTVRHLERKLVLQRRRSALWALDYGVIPPECSAGADTPVSSGTSRHSLADRSRCRCGCGCTSVATHSSRHGTARHGTARHGTARHGTAPVKQATVPMAAVVLPWYCELPQLYIVSVVLIVSCKL